MWQHFAHQISAPTRIAAAVRMPSVTVLYLVLTGLLTLYPSQPRADTAWPDVRQARILIPGDAPFLRLERIDERELAELRGGLSIAGIDIDFGATLRTVIDTIELQTSYRITAMGIDVLSHGFSTPGIDEANQQAANSTVESATKEPGRVSVPMPAVSQLTAGLVVNNPGSRATENVDSAPRHGGVAGEPTAAATLVGPDTGISVMDIAPADIDLSGVADYRGIVVNDVKGFTAAIHHLSHKAIISSIVSNASERKISQRLNIDLRIGNLKQIRASALRSALARRDISHR